MAKKSAMDTDFLRQLERFHIVLKKKISSKYQGSRQTTHSGGGLTFKDYKEYVPGDDFRNIDWKVYSRTGKFFVRRFEEERNMVVRIIIDSSKSMDFGTPRKFDMASLLAVGFSYLAMRNNEKFELATFSDELTNIRAKKGRQQIARLMAHLESVSVKGKSEFSTSLESAKSLIKSRSLVIILSDFLYDITEIRNTLYRFKHSEVLCVQILTPLEKSFSIEGDYLLKDSEQGIELKTFVTRRLKSHYRSELENHNLQITKICEDLRHHFISVSTDMNVFDAFFKAYVALENN